MNMHIQVSVHVRLADRLNTGPQAHLEQQLLVRVVQRRDTLVDVGIRLLQRAVWRYSLRLRFARHTAIWSTCAASVDLACARTFLASFRCGQ
jgi:hypothetical protein